MSFLTRYLPTSHNTLESGMLVAAHHSLISMHETSGESLKAAVRALISEQAEALRVDRLF